MTHTGFSVMICFAVNKLEGESDKHHAFIQAIFLNTSDKYFTSSSIPISTVHLSLVQGEYHTHGEAFA